MVGIAARSLHIAGKPILQEIDGNLDWAVERHHQDAVRLLNFSLGLFRKSEKQAAIALIGEAGCLRPHRRRTLLGARAGDEQRTEQGDE